jgi:hypothetical protein
MPPIPVEKMEDSEDACETVEDDNFANELGFL